MPQVFISYRRVPSAMLAQLLAKELKQRGIDVYLDVRQTDGAGPFPDRLLHAIDACDVFVCLVANGTFDSDWVRREIEHARNTGKRMIPVFQESYQSLAEYPTAAIADLLGYDGVHIFDIKNVLIDQSIEALARMVDRTEKPVRKFPLVAALLSAAGGFVLLALVMVLSRGGGGLPDITATLNAILADFSTQTAVAQAMLPSDTPPPATSTPTDDLTSTAQAQMTLDAQATARAPTNTPQPSETPIPTATVDVGATRTATAAVAAAATQARLDALATIRVENAAAFATARAMQTQEASVNSTHTQVAAVFATFRAARRTATAWADETQARATSQAARLTTEAIVNARATATAAAAVFATFQAERLTETAASPIIFSDDFSVNFNEGSGGDPDPFVNSRIGLGQLRMQVRQAGHWLVHPFENVSVRDFYATATVRVAELPNVGCVGYYMGSLGGGSYYMIVVCKNDRQFVTRVYRYSQSGFTALFSQVTTREIPLERFQLSLEAVNGIYRLSLDGVEIYTVALNPTGSDLGFVVINDCCGSGVLTVYFADVLVKREK